MAAEVEAEAVALLGAAQAADARLALEHRDLGAGARQMPRRGRPASAAAEDGHAHHAPHYSALRRGYLSLSSWSRVVSLSSDSASSCVVIDVRLLRQRRLIGLRLRRLVDFGCPTCARWSTRRTRGARACAPSCRSTASPASSCRSCRACRCDSDWSTVFGTSTGLVASPGSAGVVSSMRPAFSCIGVRVSLVTGPVADSPARPAEPLCPGPAPTHAAGERQREQRDAKKLVHDGPSVRCPMHARATHRPGRATCATIAPAAHMTS